MRSPATRSFAATALALVGAVGSSVLHCEERSGGGPATVGTAAGAGPSPSLFRNPPREALPRTWWHWMNGNVTREGITADLEWMSRVGIGGFDVFDVVVGTPQFTAQRVAYLSPEWREMVRHAAHEADRLDLDMGFAASPGFSESGGPWVRAEQAMKKVVWSQIELAGPVHFSGQLPAPPRVNGRYLDIPRSTDEYLDIPVDNTLPGALPPKEERKPLNLPTHYSDIALIAVPLPANLPALDMSMATLSLDGQSVDASALFDRNNQSSFTIEFGADTPTRNLHVDFPADVQVSSLTLAEAVTPTTAGFTPGSLEYTRNGHIWTRIVAIEPLAAVSGSSPSRTYAFEPVIARRFRLSFSAPQPSPLQTWLKKPQRHAISFATFELGNTPQVNRWEDKAQFGHMSEFGPWSTPATDSPVASSASVVDLTSKLRADGSLTWEVPAGRWMLMRVGYSLTGAINHPAQPEGVGFEVDKLDPKAVSDYLDAYLDELRKAAGPFFGKSVNSLLLDSWEAGHANWTPQYVAEFTKRRGYDPRAFLPVLGGVMIDSPDVSERFLRDHRRTLADMLAENHFGTLTERAHKAGLRVYGEAMGVGAPTTGDGILNKSFIDVPMGEFWVHPGLSGAIPAPQVADLQEAASAAHVYGKSLVAAESFTTLPSSLVPSLPAWGQAPSQLKPVADRAFSLGVNQIVFHTSAHQPFVDDQHKPGLTMGGFGQHYTRNNTWAEQARVWNEYLARCSYMLQRGLPVVDLLYFYGSDAPATVPFWKPVDPAVPVGFSHDWIDERALLSRLSVRDGRLVLPDGMNYRMLVVPSSIDKLLPEVVEALRKLIAAGATVIARPPSGSPSLSGYPHADAEIARTVSEVWGHIGSGGVVARQYGQGSVHWGTPVGEVLEQMQVNPDFSYEASQPKASITWTHRLAGETDIYFVANLAARLESIKAKFRVTGKVPVLWHPDSGTFSSIDYASQGGTIQLALELEPHGSVFVVFDGPAQPARAERVSARTVRGLPGPWVIHFSDSASQGLAASELRSWTQETDPSIMYFSGTARYESQFPFARQSLGSSGRVYLDLGVVKEMAELRLNGERLPQVLWKPPFRADITELLVDGENRIEIYVTNLWTNRMIGDQQPGAKRQTFTDFTPFSASSPLLESGLLGPVTLITELTTSTPEH